jgi:hypothetical protein
VLAASAAIAAPCAADALPMFDPFHRSPIAGAPST